MIYQDDKFRILERSVAICLDYCAICKEFPIDSLCFLRHLHEILIQPLNMGKPQPKTTAGKGDCSILQWLMHVYHMFQTDHHKLTLLRTMVCHLRSVWRWSPSYFRSLVNSQRHH